MAKKKKEEPEVVDDRAEQLGILIKAAQKKFGQGAVGFSKDYNHAHLPRITTGILGLDIALGGGLPVGRVSMFWGQESTSKTTCFLRAAGRAQRMCSNCWTPAFPLYTPDYGDMEPSCACGKYRRTIIACLDVEGVWDDNWSQRFLRRDDTLLISQPETGEQASDIADGLLRSGAVDIIIIDSIAMMTPVEEIEKSAHDNVVGAQARMLSSYFRKLTAGLNALMSKEGRKPSVWLTNQVRYKVGVMFGNPETKPGGQAQKFVMSTSTRMSQGKKDVDSETKQTISQLFKYRNDKNKTTTVKMDEGEYKMCVAELELKRPGDIMDESYAVRIGSVLGLVEVGRGAASYGDMKFRGKSLLERYFMENRDEYETYKANILALIAERGGIRGPEKYDLETGEVLAEDS